MIESVISSPSQLGPPIKVKVFQNGHFSTSTVKGKPSHPPKKRKPIGKVASSKKMNRPSWRRNRHKDDSVILLLVDRESTEKTDDAEYTLSLPLHPVTSSYHQSSTVTDQRLTRDQIQFIENLMKVFHTREQSGSPDYHIQKQIKDRFEDSAAARSKQGILYTSKNQIKSSL